MDRTTAPCCDNCRWSCSDQSYQQCVDNGMRYFEVKMPRPNQAEEKKEDE